MAQSVTFEAPLPGRGAPPRAQASTPAAQYAADHWLATGVLIALLAMLLLAYGNTLEQTMLRWDNPKYSHGYLVPAFALVLLWIRRSVSSQVDLLDLIFRPTSFWRGSETSPPPTKAMKLGLAAVGIGVALIGLTILTETFAPLPLGLTRSLQMLGVIACTGGALVLIDEPITLGNWTDPIRLGGLGLLIVSLAIRLLSTYQGRVVPELYSFITAMFGVFMMVGGGKAVRWAWPSVLFLVFMFPLPDFVETVAHAKLQSWATIASNFCLQTLGLSSYAEGNRIIVAELPMNVEEQCSGLRMLTIFIALGAAVALVAQRPMWERVVLLLSSVPIALAVNVIRITVTGICYYMAAHNIAGMTTEMANKIFHDAAGLVMMPLAMGMLYVVYQVLAHLVIDDGPTGPVNMGLGTPRLP